MLLDDLVVLLPPLDGTWPVVLPQLDPPHLLRDILARPELARFKLALLRRTDVVAVSIPAPSSLPASRS